MKLAYIYEQDKIAVHFDSPTVRHLLKTYFLKTQDIDQALDRLESELKKEILKI